jgi:hypothetical protein
MTTLVLLLAASSVGIEAGWKPLATGGHEYTVQIEPELVRLLETGNDLVSEVPPEIHVRSLRITVQAKAYTHRRTTGTHGRRAMVRLRPQPRRRDDLPKFAMTRRCRAAD